jgi:hypothetical protein
MESRMRPAVDALVAEHGTVPPPWVVYFEHPYNICWRMGGGQGHMLLWWAWWEEQGFTEEQKVAYFHPWPPPHCWLAFLIQAVWGVDIFEEQDKIGPYFERTAALGFGSHQEYERDLADPKWLAKLVATLSAAGDTAGVERVRAVIEQLRRAEPTAPADGGRDPGFS